MFFNGEEYGKHMIPVPIGIGGLAHCIPIVLAGTVILHAVNRGGSTINTAALPRICFSGLWDRLGLVVERVLLTSVQKEKSFGDMNHWIQIRATTFQNENSALGPSPELIGERCPTCSSTDDDIIKNILTHDRPPG